MDLRKGQKLKQKIFAPLILEPLIDNRTSRRVIYVLLRLRSLTKKIVLLFLNFPRRFRIRYSSSSSVSVKTSSTVLRTTGYSKYSFVNALTFDFSQLKSVAYVGNYFVNNSTKFLESDMAVNFRECMSSLGLGVDFSSSHLNHDYNRPDFTKDFKNNEIESFLHSTDSNLIFFDSNFLSSKNCPDPEKLIQIKKKLDKRYVALVPDFKRDALVHYKDAVDLFLMTLPEYRNQLADIKSDKLLFMPFLPYCHSSFFYFQQPKSLDFFFSGSPNKNRRDFLYRLDDLGVSAEVHFHSRQQSDGLSLEVYLKKVASAKSTFSNGYLNRHLNFISARMAESILLKTVCIYERCKSLEYFFQPNVDYISVTNRNELFSSIKEIKQSSSLYHEITSAASQSFLTHFDFKKIYSEVFRRVLNR